MSDAGRLLISWPGVRTPLRPPQNLDQNQGVPKAALQDNGDASRSQGEPYHRRVTFTVRELAMLSARFWSFVDMSTTDPAGCWPWKGGRGFDGYGQWHPAGKIHTPAHRFAAALKIGRSLLPTEEAMHICHNPPCCRPEHLKAGSHSENMQMSMAAGRGRRGENQYAAHLTHDVVADLRRRAATEKCPGWMTSQARALGVPPNVVANAVGGRTYKTVPFAVPAIPRKVRTESACVRGHSLFGDNARNANGSCRACSRGFKAAYKARQKAKAQAQKLAARLATTGAQS